jgi:ribonuclease BN (tRNA processing enzyme)
MIIRLGLALRLAMLALSGAGMSAMAATASTDATTAVAIAPVERTKLILLGTAAGPVPKATRSQPATAIVVDGKVYLFDVGNGVLRQLAKAGYSVSDVAGIFITHNHFDHNADLGSVMAFRWMAGGASLSRLSVHRGPQPSQPHIWKRFSIPRRFSRQWFRVASCRHWTPSIPFLREAMA